MTNAHNKPTTMHAPEPDLFVENQYDREIAGGIAYDSNNLLMLILGHAELLSMGNLSPETQSKYIGRIEYSIKQIRNQARRAAHSQVACG